MADRDLIVSIDRHLDEITEEVRLHRREAHLFHEEIRLSREQRERSDERYGGLVADTRQFMREQIERLHKLTEPQIAALRDIQDTQHELVIEIREFRMEHREAMTRILRRLGPGEAGA